MLLCRVYEACGSRVEDAWVLQSDFQASRSAACTSICWRPHSAGLPSVLAVGTAEGAKVGLLINNLLLHQCHPISGRQGDFNDKQGDLNDKQFKTLQVFYYNMRCMSWELATNLGQGYITDVKWASSATTQAANLLAVASKHEVVLYQLEGPVDKLQVMHSKEHCSREMLHFEDWS